MQQVVDGPDFDTIGVLMVLAVGEAQGDGYGLAGGGLAGEVLGQAFGTEHVELGELVARFG